MASEGTRDFVRVIASYFLPPLGVFMQIGLGTHFWINLILSLLGYFPGVIHALWVVSSVGEDGEQAAAPESTLIALVLGFFLPPIAAFWRGGLVAGLINCLLTLMLWFPGQLHAAWVVCQANVDE